MLRALLIGVLLLTATQARGEDEGYIDYRQNLMRSLGANMGAIGDILKYQLQLDQNVAGHAASLEAGAGLILAAFEQRVTEGKTDAKPEIWDDRPGFEEALAEFRAEVSKLVEVSSAGDMGAVGGQVQALGKSCGGCHKPYRKPKEESYKNR